MPCACGNQSSCIPPARRVDHSSLDPFEQPAAQLLRAANRWQARSLPKVVHQTWKTCGPLPERQQAWRDECMRLNPEWQFYLWSDEDNDQLVAHHYPVFHKVYTSAHYTGPSRHMKRVDAVRYLYLHRFGGIYMDLDFACLRPFDTASMLSSGSATFSFQAHGRASLDNLTSGVAGQAVANNFMAAPPAHPFTAFAMSSLIAVANKSVVEATGPHFLTRVLAEYLGELTRSRHGEKQRVMSQINIEPMPRIYATEWWQLNPCGTGLPHELACCRALLNGTLLATFWTMVWYPDGRRQWMQRWARDGRDHSWSFRHRAEFEPPKLLATCAGKSQN